MDTSGLITLKSVAKTALKRARRPEDEYFQFYQLAHDAYLDLRLKHVREGVRFVKVTPDVINCVYFPDDWQDFVAIGVPVNGKVVRLTREDDIVSTTSLVGAVETLDPDDGEGVDIEREITYGYSARGGDNAHGYYKIDWDHRRIIINSNTRTELILAYVTSGTSATGDTYVPVKYREAMIAYIVWKDAQYDDLRVKMADYYEMQYRKAINELDEAPTLDEWLDALYETYSMITGR